MLFKKQNFTIFDNLHANLPACMAVYSPNFPQNSIIIIKVHNTYAAPDDFVDAFEKYCNLLYKKTKNFASMLGDYSNLNLIVQYQPNYI